MKKLLIMMCGLLLLAGCSDATDIQEPTDPKDPTDITEPTDPVELETFQIKFHTKFLVSIDPITIEENDIPVIEDPVVEGYNFMGWYTDGTYSTKYEPSKVTGNMTLYGNFEAVKTKITFMYNGEIIGTNTLKYGVKETLGPVFSMGHQFDGWFSDEEKTMLITEVTGTLEDQVIYLGMSEALYMFEPETDLDLTTLGYYEYLSDENPEVTIVVEGIGTMVVQLFPEVAENTVNNFLTYVINEDYTSSSFHRIIDGFMIQGGKIIHGTRGSIKGEFSDNGVINNLKHTPGVISMARTVNPNSATSQFFIMDSSTTSLDGSYAAFGGLVSGFNVLEFISQVNTYSDDSPTVTISIQGMTVELNGYVVDEVIYYD